MNHIQFEPLSNKVIGCAIEVHRQLGPGLLESAYEQCLARELSLNGIPFELQKPIPISYKGIHIECGYRLDLLVGGEVAVELKSVAGLKPVHEAQLLTYLRLARLRAGPLINFNVPLLKQGIKRLVI